MRSKKQNSGRRDFLKKSGLLGLGVAGAGAGTIGCTTQKKPFRLNHSQQFNMHGYAAPKLDIVRMAVIGIGNRGSGTVRRFASIEGVEIKAVCDLEPDRANQAAKSLKELLGYRPDAYSGGEDEWKKVCERPDIDLIAIVTPWDLHTPMCVYGMENGKHVCTELPAALTIEECWQLVETSERTRKHCMQISSTCNVGIKAVVLNMVREGLFGDIIHAEGAYIHDLLLGYLFNKDKYHNNWRLKENIGKHGNLYPQHGLVPILQMMDINYGDKLEYLSSLSTIDFTMNATAKKLAAEDDYYAPYVGSDFRGNMNTTIIRTNKGRSIMMQHDVTSPRPNVRFKLISGTEGMYIAGPDRIAKSHAGWIPEKEFNSLVEKYTPVITKRFNELISQAKEIPDNIHSFFHDVNTYYKVVTPTDWRIIDCLRNGLPMDMDVYEAAVSSAIIPLSQWSVAHQSNSVEIPDFTAGAWNTNKRGMDINLENDGGTSKIQFI